MLESDEEKHLFKELYERYGNAMLRVAQRYFPSDLTAAEDAVQNAWLKVIKNFSKIQEDSSNKRGAYLVAFFDINNILIDSLSTFVSTNYEEIQY
jgi:RNA polymerase sigma-70 factor (ECF subfamily)